MSQVTRPRDGEAGSSPRPIHAGADGHRRRVALVVDGGNAYAHQRISQNASDAAAEAGAIVLAQSLNGDIPTDDEVWSAVEGVLASMGMDVDDSSAEYTDINGTGLDVIVGESPTGEPPAGATGVAVAGERDFGTFFARALGINQFSATTHATAVAGFTQTVRVEPTAGDTSAEHRHLR